MKDKDYKEFYVSVDVEASGPVPGKYSMTSIGAFIAGARKIDDTFVQFDHSDESKKFYRELKPMNDNYVPSAITVGKFDCLPDTATAQQIQEFLMSNGAYPFDVMTDFSDWVKDFSTELNATPVFMAFPASFDWTFVYWYFGNFDVPSPFGFSRVLDLKSYCSSQYGKPLNKSTKRELPRRLFSKLPHTHRSIDDAVEQGIFGMNVLADR